MNKNIIQFTTPKSVEDEAADWLIKMDGDKPLNKLQQSEFSHWINANPKHRSEFFELCEVWDNVPVEHIHELLTNQTIQPLEKQKSITNYRPAYALCSVLILAFIGWFMSNNPAHQYQKNGVYITSIGEQQQHELDDGSVIHLNTNSRVQVEYTDEVRNIWLIYGEAHFNVSKNPNKPFRVYAADGRVQAVGTAFNVKLYKDSLDVLVTEGRIAIATMADTYLTTPFNKNKTLTDASEMEKALTKIGELDAGQGIRINSQHNTGSSNIQSLDKQEVLRRQAWRTGILLFDGQPMSEFIDEISRFTHASFIIDDPSVAAIKVGGRYKLDKLDQVLVALRENFDIKVTQTGNSSYKLSKKDKIE